jgi:hypothetical protein
MSEFVFRNLSVKVFPTEVADRGCVDGVSRVVGCSPCTELCTGTVTPCDDPPLCTAMEESIPITIGPVCNGPGTSPGYVDTHTNLILPAGDPGTELATLKQSLRIAMSAVEKAEQQLESGQGLSVVDGIDRLRGELMGAVAELDEYRDQIDQ